MTKFIFIILTFVSLSLPATAQTNRLLEVGAERMEEYLPLLRGKRVGIVANHTTWVKDSHLVDSLYSSGVDIEYIFSPEHGFRGDADAGEKVKSYIDSKTGIRVVSLYGSTPAPPDSIMRDLDILIYDLQDVGVRYFTYISTLKYCMEKVAKWDKQLIILDRPNPNISLVDGPILDMRHKSFVGVFPIPILYGMTAGELALMANDKGWAGDKRCDIKIVECLGYSRDSRYTLPVKPSPNLPNMLSIYLYPSLCYFEATDVSLGRGTETPFQIYGHPKMEGYTFSFTPRSVPGAKYPPQQNKKCYGVDLSSMDIAEARGLGVDLEYLIDSYNKTGCNPKFFNSFFEKLIGVSYVKQMIMAGKSADEIEERWSNDVAQFKLEREKYLIYKADEQ